MDKINIVAGELAELSSMTSGIAEEVGGQNVEAAVGDVGSAMPGASSMEDLVDTARGMDDRRVGLRDRYADFSDDVKAADAAYGENEASVECSLRSAGDLADKLAERMEQ